MHDSYTYERYLGVLFKKTSVYRHLTGKTPKPLSISTSNDYYCVIPSNCLSTEES